MADRSPAARSNDTTHALKKEKTPARTDRRSQKATCSATQRQRSRRKSTRNDPPGTNNRGAQWCVYALNRRGNFLYVGITNDLRRRLQRHQDGKGSKFVRSRRPFELLKVIPCPNATEARQTEHRLKKMKRSQKMKELGIDIEIHKQREQNMVQHPRQKPEKSQKLTQRASR
jgi:putative endonuclease